MAEGTISEKRGLETLIYPRPQWIETVDRLVTLAHPLRVATLDEDYATEAQSLVMDLGRRVGCSAEMAASAEDADVLIGGLDSPGMAAELRSRGLEPRPETRQAEAYMLQVCEAGALVAGFDPAGAFYGTQSLLQVLDAGAISETAVRVPGLRVDDWAYKSLRGMHLYMPGREQIPFFKDLLTWLASLKYNTLFLEVGGGMRYDRHPEINAAWERFCQEADAYPGGARGLQAMSAPFMKDSTHTELGGGSYLEKEEVAEILAAARDLHIEVVPEVQALSHAYYLCMAHPEIAERADDDYPDTFCPSHPKSYELLFDVMEEVIEVFEPRMIHIGHDEVYHMGICPRCRDKTGSELLGYELERIHSFLAERGIRMGMWCDKLLPFNVRGQGGVEIIHENRERSQYTRLPETYGAIEDLPRDVLISEWLGNTDRRAADFLLAEGFEVVCGNFGNNFAAMEFLDWEGRSADAGMVGGEVPSWCDNSAFALGYNGCLFRALFAPQMLWWEHYRETDRAATAMAVASRAPAARTRLEGVVAPSRRSGATLVPLTLENVTLSAPPFGAGRLADAPEGFVVNGAWQAVRGDAQSSQTRIELAGETALSGTERGLLLLHGCETELVRAPTWNTADPYHHPSENLLAVYRMHHASGIVSDVDVHYGSHVARWDVPYGEHIDAVPFWADPVSIGRDPSGRQVTLYRLEWTNPRSDDPVVALEIEYTGDKTGALWLFAVTAVEIGTVGEIA